MLHQPQIVAAVANAVSGCSPPPLLVVDPVFVSSSGDQLGGDDVVEAVVEKLLPLSTIVTPNLPEAERLTGT